MMEANQMTKKFLNFQKGAITQWCDVMTSIQDRTASSLTAVLARSLWMPDEGCQMIENWVSACKKGCYDYKELVEDSISGLEDVLFIPSKKVATSKKAAAAKKASAMANSMAAAKVEATGVDDASANDVQPDESKKDTNMATAMGSAADKDKPAK